MRTLFKSIVFSLFLLVFSIGNTYGGTCASPDALTINGGCLATTVNNAATISAPASCTGTISREEWYSFAGTAGTNYSIGFTNATGTNPAIAIYTGACGSQTLVTCANALGTGAGNSEVVSFTAASTTTYYVVVFNYGTGGAAGNMGGNLWGVTNSNIILQTAGASSTVCNASFYDRYGPCYNTPNSSNTTQTICPATAGQCVSVTFNSFSLDNGFDFLLVFDGNSTTVNQFTGSPYTGNTIPGPFTATTTNASGCLTFQFLSDGLVSDVGWDATISCAACAAPASATSQDCGAATQVCSDASFTNNSSSSGSFQDLNLNNEGCLFMEHQSSWYTLTLTTGGTFALNITPSVATDYDFAIWGPLSTLSCPPVGAPLRCSYYLGNGNTGMIATEAAQTSEPASGAGGTVAGYTTTITGATGDSYLLLVDNYSGSNQPFTLDWTMSGGATLGCTPLPIELLDFSGKSLGKKNLLQWTTASETNNDYFTLEHSNDAVNFTEVAQVNGHGNSSIQRNYQCFDHHPFEGTTYYRLSQTDFNGDRKFFGIIHLDSQNDQTLVGDIHPNPTNDNVAFDFYCSESGTLVITVMDYTGRLVKKIEKEAVPGKNVITAELSELPLGVYSIRMDFGPSGFSSVSRLIKN